MDPTITDTDRLDFLADRIARSYGSEPGDFRDHIDRQIRQVPAARPPAWIDLTMEFPNDETPVCVQASEGMEGIVCYDSTAGDWYVHLPGTDLHGRLWSEVHGPESEILRWHPVKG